MKTEATESHNLEPRRKRKGWNKKRIQYIHIKIALAINAIGTTATQEKEDIVDEVLTHRLQEEQSMVDMWFLRCRSRERTQRQWQTQRAKKLFIHEHACVDHGMTPVDTQKNDALKKTSLK